MQICHKSVKTVTGTLCSGTVVPYHRNSHFIYKNEDISISYIEPHIVCHKTTKCMITLSHIRRLTVEKVAHAIIKTKHYVCLPLKR